jgi:hypothetical protein
MQRRAIPAQKEAPWGLGELLTAAAKVDDGVAWLEVKAGKMVDVGILVIATFPDDVDETEPSGDDDKCVPSGVEVTYGCCKHVSAYKMMSWLTEMGADICSTIRSYDMNTYDMIRGLPARIMTRKAELTPVLLRWPSAGNPRV